MKKWWTLKIIGKSASQSAQSQLGERLSYAIGLFTVATLAVILAADLITSGLERKDLHESAAMPGDFFPGVSYPLPPPSQAENRVRVPATKSEEMATLNDEKVQKLEPQESQTAKEDLQNFRSAVVMSEQEILAALTEERSRTSEFQKLQAAQENLQSSRSTPGIPKPHTPGQGDLPIRSATGMPKPHTLAQGDPLLEARIRAGKKWLSKSGAEAFTVQVMTVSRESLGDLRRYLTRPDVGISPDNVFIFPLAGERLLMYYGHFQSKDKALSSVSALPEHIRQTKPYVLSVNSVQEKIIRLSKISG